MRICNACQTSTSPHVLDSQNMFEALFFTGDAIGFVDGTKLLSTAKGFKSQVTPKKKNRQAKYTNNFMNRI